MINLFDFSKNQSTQPTKTLNFGAPMSGPGITNFSDFKANLAQQAPMTTPKPATQKSSGFSIVPKANASESMFDTYMNDPNISKQGKFKMLSDVKNGVLTEEDANGIISQIYGGAKPQQPIQAKENLPGFDIGVKTSQGLANIGKGLKIEAGNSLVDSKNPFVSSFGNMVEAFKFVGNVAGDTVELAGELGQVIANPIGSAKDLKTLAEATVETGLNKLFGTDVYTTEDKRAMIEGVSQALEENFGTLEKAKNTIIENPTDVLTTFVGGLGAAKTGVKNANTIAKIDKLQEALNPINILRTEVGAITGAGKGVIKGGGKVLEAGGKVIDYGSEKIATKLLGSSDGKKELFKATSPSYATLGKDKNIKNIVQNAAKADETIVKYGRQPVDTETRVTAYVDTMKDVWKRVEEGRGGTPLKTNANTFADEIDNFIESLSRNGKVNPEFESDINALIKQADYYRSLGEIDVPTLGKIRGDINAITSFRQGNPLGDIYNTGLKNVGNSIRNTENSLIQSVKGTQFGELMKEYKALAEMYPDIIKANIKNLRAKGLPIEEALTRASGLADIGAGLIQTVTNPKLGFAQMAKGAGTAVLGRSFAKLKDVDFLIQQGYEKLIKSKGNKNVIPNNRSNPINSNSKVTPKNIGQDRVIPKTKKSFKELTGQDRVIPKPAPKKPSVLSDRERKLLKPSQPTTSKVIPKTTNTKTQLQTTLKSLTNDNIDEVVSNVAKTLKTTKTAEIKQIINKYLKEFGEDIKNYLGLLADDIADLVGGRAKLLGGENAKLFDKSRWQQAKDMTKAGKSADEVWEKTGWEKGADGKWRFEIDDSKAKVLKTSKELDDWQTRIGVGKTLPEVIEHPTLYKQYPEIKNLRVKVDFDGNGGGSFNEVDGVITVNGLSKGLPINPEKIKSTLLHEIQHYIQSKEGFARGGSPDLIKGNKAILEELEKQRSDLTNEYGYKKWNFELLQKDNKKYNKLLEEGREELTAEPFYKEFAKEKLDKEFQGFFVNKMKYYDNEISNYREWNIDPMRGYQKLGGEVEARNIQSRLLKKASDNKKVRPELTEDTPRSKQIIKRDGGTAMSVSDKQGIGADKTKMLSKTIPKTDELSDLVKEAFNKKINPGDTVFYKDKMGNLSKSKFSKFDDNGNARLERVTNLGTDLQIIKEEDFYGKLNNIGIEKQLDDIIDQNIRNVFLVEDGKLDYSKYKEGLKIENILKQIYDQANNKLIPKK